MSKTRKAATTPATKADITLILEKLGTMADDVSASKRSIDSLERKFGEHQKEFATLQKAFAVHDRVMHSQFETILKHIDAKAEEVSEHFDEKFEKLDDAFFDKAALPESSLRELDRRLRVVERRVGVPS